MRTIILASAVAALAAPAFADNVRNTNGGYETAEVTHDVAELCKIVSTGMLEQAYDPAGNSFTFDIECNTEFGLEFNDVDGGNGDNRITLFNPLWASIDKNGDQYVDKFTGTASLEPGLQVAVKDGAVQGDFAAQDATATYSIAWNVPTKKLVAGAYKAAADVALTFEEI